MAAALLAVFCLLAGACAAEGTVMLAQVGYDGTILCGKWIPLEVELTAQTDVRGMLSVAVYQESDRYDTVQIPVEAAAGETARVHLPILPLVPQRRFAVTLTAEGQTPLQATAVAAREVDGGDIVIGVLGDPAGELAQALRVTQSRDPLKRGDLIETVSLSAQAFPHDEREMAAFDVIALDGFDVATLGEAQRALLEGWLLDGGVIIAGTGDGRNHSLGWLGERTGVTALAETSMDGALEAVQAYAGMTAAQAATALTGEGGETEATSATGATGAAGEDGAAMAVRPLRAGDGALAELDGACLLAGTPCGEGYVLTAGFSLSDPQAIEAEKEALWQRVLLAADPQRYDAMENSRYSGSNYRYPYGVTSTMRVSVGVSMLPVAAVLAAYVLLAGAGLYLALKRRDRSRLLWALIPLSSVACVALVAAMSAALGLDRPAAASLTIAEYDERGETFVEEHAAVAYPQQTRVTLRARDGSRVEHAASWYYRGYSEIDEQTTQRDRITLGERPALELRATAPWLEQNLVILDTAKPDGRVSGRAWMEEDGLHAAFENGTGATLTDAVLLTQLGYMEMGDIAPGETAEAFLMRVDAPMERNESGGVRIFPNTLLKASEPMYRVGNACVYPERERDTSLSVSALSKAERYAREIRSEILSLAQRSADAMAKDQVCCVLVARSEALAATELELDGREIDRTAHAGVVLARAGFETVGPTGVIYYPESAFAAHSASLSPDGTPSIAEETQRYYVALSADTAFGFRMEGVDASKVTRIRVVHGNDDTARQEIEMAVYDHESGKWTPLAYDQLVELEGELARRATGETGELFLRYSAAGERGDLSVPQIIVEGSEAI